jgi:hypothetical protein
MSLDTPIQGGLTAHQEQALSARLVHAHKTPTAAPRSAYWTPAMGRSAVARAESWLGMPYSWAGGSASGPTQGQCDPGTGGDLDCHVVGFDCSGLMMYAWGAYMSLPHLASAQQQVAGSFHPTRKQLLPGDLVFFSGYIPGGTGHVAIYIGDGMVIEAPESGAVVHRTSLADLITYDAYRGAVRPLTAQTPTLIAPHGAVPNAGGTVTLHGRYLAHANAVHIGGATVRHFVRRSDSTIVFHAPAHHDGRVAVAVSTPWVALSRSVTLTYGLSHPTSPSSPTHRPAPSSPGPSTPGPTTPPATTTPPPTTTPPTTTPPTSTAPPSPAPSTVAPTPSVSSTVSSPPPPPASNGPVG